MRLYTVGHSTRTIQELIAVLKAHRIEAVADVRHYPGSRKFPWFGKESLKKSLEAEGIKYFWIEKLGGFRKGGYEAHMRTEEYAQGIAELLEIASKYNTAVMCAEILWFRCHRRYISGYLAAQGHEIIHIYNEKKAEVHNILPHKDKKVFCDKRQKNEKEKNGVRAAFLKLYLRLI